LVYWFTYLLVNLRSERSELQGLQFNLTFMKTIEDVVKAWNLTPLPPKQFNMVRAHRVYDSTYPILTVAGINKYDQTLACHFSHLANGYIMYRLEWNEERQEYDAYSL
jgi:hypothetical protein